MYLDGPVKTFSISLYLALLAISLQILSSLQNMENMKEYEENIKFYSNSKFRCSTAIAREILTTQLWKYNCFKSFIEILPFLVVDKDNEK